MGGRGGDVSDEAPHLRSGIAANSAAPPGEPPDKTPAETPEFLPGAPDAGGATESGTSRSSPQTKSTELQHLASVPR